MSDRLRLEPGLVLGERFEIRHHLGSGGYGDVYAAVNTSLGTEVAIKVRGKGTPARFWREARLAARLESPFTVRVFDVGWQGELLYIVMERLRGRSLQSFLAEHGRLDQRRALTWCRQLSSALAEAHSMRLVHRDIKPSNVFICETAGGDQHVKLLDFGLAKDLVLEDDPDTTASGVLLGTPSYMSPEQVRGDTLTVHSDLWSVGVVLFEMLTGSRPFAGTTRAVTLVSILTDPAPRLSSTGCDASDEVERLVARCLRKLPSERHDSAEELRRQLDLLLSDTSTPPTAREIVTDSTQQSVSFTAIPRPSATTGGPLPHRRTPPLWLALGAVIALGAVLAVLASRPPFTNPVTRGTATKLEPTLPAPPASPVAPEPPPNASPSHATSPQRAALTTQPVQEPLPAPRGLGASPHTPHSLDASPRGSPHALRSSAPRRAEPGERLAPEAPPPASSGSNHAPPKPDQPPLIREPDF